MRSLFLIKRKKLFKNPKRDSNSRPAVAFFPCEFFFLEKKIKQF